MKLTGPRHDSAAQERLVELVDAYARRIYPTVLVQHPEASVSSPLGVWLLLASVVGAADGEDRASLEGSLGCRADEAVELLAAFAADPSPALRAAIAVWWRPGEATPQLANWMRNLSPVVESASMPTQDGADQWANSATDGLIERFPMQIDAQTRIVLASALATRVTWHGAFDVVPAAEHLAASSPWHGVVNWFLLDRCPAAGAGIAKTRAAGLVAVHVADAVEQVGVLSVSAAPSVSRIRVLEAAHELIALTRKDRIEWPLCSLFDVPLGTGHSWHIAESQVANQDAGARVERILGVSLPAWSARSELDIEEGAAFGATAALRVLRRLIGAQAGERAEARQAAAASFTQRGFDAAAVTYLGIRTSLTRQTGTERTVTLRFDHPYAALAIAAPSMSSTGPAPTPSALAGMPLFATWIHSPDEPEGDPLE